MAHETQHERAKLAEYRRLRWWALAFMLGGLLKLGWAVYDVEFRETRLQALLREHKAFEVESHQVMIDPTLDDLQKSVRLANLIDAQRAGGWLKERSRPVIVPTTPEVDLYLLLQMPQVQAHFSPVRAERMLREMGVRPSQMRAVSEVRARELGLPSASEERAQAALFEGLRRGMRETTAASQPTR